MSYLSEHNRGPDTRGVAIAIAVHAGIVGAYLLMPPISVQTLVPDEIEAIFVKPVAKPDPLEPPPQPKSEDPAAPLPTPAPPDRIIDLPAPPDTGPPVKLLPLPSTPGSGGTGVSEPPVTPRPAPPPVLTEPLLDQRYASRFQPPYPTRLLRQEIEGDVSVRVLVGTDGRVKRIELVSGDEPDLWRATERHALKHWRFVPATRGDEKVEAWKILTVRFTIND